MIYLLLKYYGHTFRSLALFETTTTNTSTTWCRRAGAWRQTICQLHTFFLFSRVNVFAFLITLSLSWRAFVSRRSNNTSFTTIVDAADGDDDHTRHTSHALLQITRTHARTLSIVRYLLDDNKYANTKHSHALWVFLYRKAHLQNEHLAHSIKLLPGEERKQSMCLGERTLLKGGWGNKGEGHSNKTGFKFPLTHTRARLAFLAS